MSRGPVSEKALADALALAGKRGSVILIRPGRDSPCNFEIVSKRESVFVTVKLSRRFHVPVEDIAWQYREEIFRLRMIRGPSTVRKELWVSSRHGSWRFFEVTDTGIAEVLVPVEGLSGTP